MLSLIDFEFLNPYMTRENMQTIYKKFMEEIKELNSNLLNRNSILESNINIDNEEDALSSNNNYEVS